MMLMTYEMWKFKNHLTNNLIFQMMAAVGELDATVDMMHRLNRQCFEKCLMLSIAEGKTRDDELSLDDDRCIENCASKFIAAQQKVGQISVSEFQKP